MSVAPTFVSLREQYFQQIERLTKSHSLRGSEALCRLLRYLAEHSLASPPTAVKEYQIATEVFGRGEDFDPQGDSTVRVQAGRLRQKLSEYYAEQGADDPIIVKLPKGSYLLSFEERSASGTVAAPRLAPRSQQPASAGTVRPWRFAAVTLAACFLLSIAGIAFLLVRKPTTGGAAVAETPETDALRRFWKPFLSGPEEPWVIFSNAAFVGRPEIGLRYYNSARDRDTPVHDHYTGVGEVLAVHALDQVFSGLSRHIRVKRGSLFSLDDAKNTDLVFVGSPSENLSLLDIPGTQEFVFQRISSGPRKGDLGIINRHPKAGEPDTFLASRSNEPLTQDYGVIGLIPGLDPSRFVLILAGTTTFGTQGAVEFVAREDCVQQLLTRLPAADGAVTQPFEALVSVKIARGVPVATDLVAVRVR